MSFSNVDSLNLGNLLQIIFSRGVRLQISKAYREWEQVKQMKVGSSLARELRFELQKNFGPAAIQYRNPGTTNRAFPTAQQSTLEEFTAKFKELEATVEIEYNLYKRALETPEKYGEPLAIEIQSKTIAMRRRIAADFYGDGTGVCGTASTVDDTSINTASSYYIIVTLRGNDTDRGHVGGFEFGDLVLCKQNGGSARTPTGGSNFYAYRVKKKDRKNSKVYLELVDSSGALVSGYTASGVVAGDVFYRVGQPTIPNLGSITDYGTATEVYAGLESLANNDARVVHGITMDGPYAGTRMDQSGNTLDSTMIQEALDAVKVNVGPDEYRWKKMCMAPEAHAALINSRETDRRFMSIEDNKRGTRYFAYAHENDVVEAYTSEFVRKNRIWGLPEAASGDGKVLESHLSDFKPIKLPGGSEFMLKPSSSGGYSNMVVSYMNGVYVLTAKHPASIWSLSNFVLPT